MPRPRRADCAHLTQGPATPMPRLWLVLGLTGAFMSLCVVGLSSIAYINTMKIPYQATVGC